MYPCPILLRRSAARVVQRGDSRAPAVQMRDGQLYSNPVVSFQQRGSMALPSAAEDEQWKCGACNADNWARRTACYVCGQPKRGGAPSSAGADAPPMMPGGHQCMLAGRVSTLLHYC